ncbi:hypothetical protein [Salisediminibacterium selenitireducens]|nr:hypothetical protein [Salisediminibacterium selenitireducens]
MDENSSKFKNFQVSSIIEKGKSFKPAQTADLSKESLSGYAIDGLKIALIPFIIMWSVAYYLYRMVMDFPFVEEASFMAEAAGIQLFRVTDMFMFVNSAGIQFDVSASSGGFNAGMVQESIHMNFGYLVFLLIVLISSFVGAWLISKFDPSFKSRSFHYPALFAGVIYMILLTGVSFVAGRTVRVPGEGAISVNFSVFSTSVLTAILLIMTVYIALMVGQFGKGAFSESDRLIPHSSKVMIGFTAALVSFAGIVVIFTVSALNNSLITMTGMFVEDLTLVRVLMVLMGGSYASLSMLQTVTTTTPDFMTVTTWAFGDLSLYNYMDIMPEDLMMLGGTTLELFFPIRLAVLVPIVVFAMAGFLYMTYIKVTNLKDLLILAVSISVSSVILGAFSNSEMVVTDSFGGGSDYTLSASVLWFRSVLMTGVFSFGILYAVHWFKTK